MLRPFDNNGMVETAIRGKSLLRSYGQIVRTLSMYPRFWPNESIINEHFSVCCTSDSPCRSGHIQPNILLMFVSYSQATAADHWSWWKTVASHWSESLAPASVVVWTISPAFIITYKRRRGGYIKWSIEWKWMASDALGRVHHSPGTIMFNLILVFIFYVIFHLLNRVRTSLLCTHFCDLHVL